MTEPAKNNAMPPAAGNFGSRRAAKGLEDYRPVSSKQPAKPHKRTGTRLIAEKFVPGEEVFECECGASMTERVRRSGKHLLVCGYCGAERELAAPAPGMVASHDLLAALREMRDLLQIARGLNAWSCTECGAEVECAAEQMVGRCGYCGSHDFTPVKTPGGVLQPQGVLRFACSPERATEMLRDWMRRQPDAPPEFAREFEVETVQARYVPYWILNVTVPDSRSSTPLAVVTNLHCCASRQLLVRMPAELRAIEPFETRMVPPFEPSQLAGVVSERFTIDLDYVWKRASSIARASADAGARRLLTAQRNAESYDPLIRREISEADVTWRVEAGLQLAEPSFKYLLIPVYFFVLKWKGREFHALMDGAGIGVGMDYPRSAARIAARRVARLVALIVLVVVAGALGLFLFGQSTQSGIAYAREESAFAADKAQQRVVAETGHRHRRERLAAEEARLLNPPFDPSVWRQVGSTPDVDRTWVSLPFVLDCDVEPTVGISAETAGSTTVVLKVRLQNRDSRNPVYLQRLNQPRVRDVASHVLATELAGLVKLSYAGEPQPAWNVTQVARRVLLSAAGLNEAGTQSAIEVAEVMRLGDALAPAFTGSVFIEFTAGPVEWLESGRVQLTLSPEHVREFCGHAIRLGLTTMIRAAFEQSGGLEANPADNELGLRVAQTAVDRFLREKAGRPGWIVTVEEVWVEPR